MDWRYLLGSLAIVELDVTIFKFKTDQNGKEYFDPIKCQNRLMIWSYSQKVSTLKQKKESNQQQIWFPFLAVFSPLIASFTRKKERGIESIMAPEASVFPLHRRPDNSDIMGKIIWSIIEVDITIWNQKSHTSITMCYFYFIQGEQNQILLFQLLITFLLSEIDHYNFCWKSIHMVEHFDSWRVDF